MDMTSALTTDTPAITGYEAELWEMADALHDSMDAAEHKDCRARARTSTSSRAWLQPKASGLVDSTPRHVVRLRSLHDPLQPQSWEGTTSRHRRRGIEAVEEEVGHHMSSRETNSQGERNTAFLVVSEH